MRVRVIDSTGSFVSFKYLASNSKSRMKKEEFKEQCDKGIFNVVNPGSVKD
jgi:hypothetical protein